MMLLMSLESKPFRAGGGVCRFLLVFEGGRARAPVAERDMALRDAAQMLRRHVIRAGREADLVTIGMPTPSGHLPVEALAALEPLLRRAPGVIDVLRD
jgi:hypothetical protein